MDAVTSVALADFGGGVMALAVFGGGGFSADGGSVFWRVAAAANSEGANFGGFGCVGIGRWSNEAVDALVVRRRWAASFIVGGRDGYHWN